MKWWVVTGLLLSLSWSGGAWGATRYVHPSGSVANTPCTSTGSPCTLAEAMRVAQNGDVVLLKNSTAHVWPEQSTVRNGVTVRGETACTVLSRNNDGLPVTLSCPVRWRCSGAQPCLNIKHQDTVVERLDLDGQNHSGGIVIKFNASGSIIQQNYIHNTNRSGIAVCGDNDCDNVTIRGNLIQDTGFSGPGEAIYMGSATSTMQNFVTNVHVYGNLVRRFTSNGVDCKKNTGTPSQDGCDVHHNVFTGQLYRPISVKCNSEGTFLSSGAGSRWIKNVIKDSGQNHVEGNCNPPGELGTDVGVAVFWANRGAVRESRAQGNVIYNIGGALKMMASFSNESHSNFATSPATVFTGNYFCNNTNYTADPTSPHVMTGNTGIPGGAAQSVCDAQESLIMNEMSALSALVNGWPFDFGGGTPPPLPVPQFVACTVPSGAANTIQLTVDARGSVPMLPASGISGFSARKNGVAWTVSSSSRTADQTFAFTMVAPAVTGDVIDLSYSQSGNVTNTAGTELETITTASCTNALTPGPTYTGLASWRLYPANCIVTLAHCRPTADQLSVGGRTFRGTGAFQVAMTIDVTGANAPSQGYGLRCRVNAGAWSQIDQNSSPIRIGQNSAAALDEMCSGIQGPADYCRYLHTSSGVSFPEQVDAGERYSIVPTLQFVGIADGDTVTCEPTLGNGTTMTISNPFTVTSGAFGNSVIYTAPP